MGIMYPIDWEMNVLNITDVISFIWFTELNSRGNEMKTNQLIREAPLI